MNVTHIVSIVCLSLSLSFCGDKSGFKGGTAGKKTLAKTGSEFDGGAAGGKNGVDGNGAGGSGIDGSGNGKAVPKGEIADDFSVSLKVDVVFAIDTSGSMSEEISATQANLGRMIATLNNGKLDSRLHVMIDTPFAVPPEATPDKTAFIKQGIGSNDGISRLNLLFAGGLNQLYTDAKGTPMVTPLAFRSDARLEIILISDDNGKGMGNTALDWDPGKNLKNYSFNAIIGLPSSQPSKACSIAAVGAEYMQLGRDTNGSVLDLCSSDWSGMIAKLSFDIVKRSVSFPLSSNPKSSTKIQVILDGNELTASDFRYDPSNNTVTLVKIDGVKHGSKLVISYDAI